MKTWTNKLKARLFISVKCVRNNKVVSGGARGPVILWHGGMNSHGVYHLGWLAKTGTIEFKAYFLSGKYLENALGIIRDARGYQYTIHSVKKWRDLT